MCEWLSHGEWCDVKLLCGGRSFNAHRAVLASVSTFLRRILLSAPSDESPTFIVLPDFDLEAMSSVLYYIYNGEVTLQKHKLRLFLDIIQAMQIFIDYQYLPKIREVVEKDNFDLNMFHEINSVKTDIFTLGFGNDNDQKYLNIRRDTQMRSVLLQYSQGKADFYDNTVRCQNGSKLRKSRLGNLKLPYGDRQRNSFLRDLFIETYPRNGNVNGLTEGVLAISNECYHSPASMLSSNANGGHLGGDSLSRFKTYSSKTSEQSLNVPAIFHDNRDTQSANNYNGICKIQQNNIVGPIRFPEDASGMSFVYGDRKTTTQGSNDRISLLPQQFNDTSLWSGLNASLDLRRTILGAMQYCVIDDSSHSVLRNTSTRCDNGEKIKDLKINRSPKIIFNQVLDNPWNPRIPKNFKPFRRKLEQSVPNQEVEMIGVRNDNNNNIQKPILEVEENILHSLETSESISPLCTKLVDSFKCTQCDQVFTTDESLALHSRRHSTNARYSCGECSKTFSQLRNFKYHMSIHRGTREFAATCTVCGKYFNDRGYLSSHMKIHRNRKEYKCTQCPKSFNQRVAYNMHVRIHTGVKPHVCEECGKAFSRKMLLKQHQRTHSGERPYACTHCDKRFADRSNMTLHLRLHTGVKPFSCSLCPKSFTKKHHLKSHLNFHTGSKPYSCPRCKLAFTQSSNMRTHYKKCSAPEPVNITDGSGNDSQTYLNCP